ncbi:N-acetyllactosaminide beta-1,6-N-acetylglucosaminyl-transferase isoform X2 [Nematostella vectensis]|uniref:N-acetyllactosaminide beta-1,6-N-acetylglucosaminyl-transferase isoform X2 n=1 Tax=Nematostella vectensis TaxID=45351 RepID=UPI00207726B8|nr:N-acetyllactosaminide beta-1,6-N-acetylglucosaminyl-transferase isoform X2 [Nematostella vectensis]
MARYPRRKLKEPDAFVQMIPVLFSQMSEIQSFHFDSSLPLSVFAPRYAQFSVVVLFGLGCFILSVFALRDATSRPVASTVHTSGRTISYSLRPNSTAWARCQSLIHGSTRPSDGGYRLQNSQSDGDIFDKYRDESCHQIRAFYPHPTPTRTELDFPIAYGILIYKGLPLFERLLQALYMPQNYYCIHIDKKTNSYFVDAAQRMVACLPNVFIAKTRVNVKWGEISLVKAELSCMTELQTFKWKYYINLVGQDFPLYNNMEIVRVLKSLHGLNNIESIEMPAYNVHRVEFVRHGQKLLRKSPPPHGLIIRKGSVHGILTRKFTEFVLRDKVARDLLKWLEDVFAADEIFFATLQYDQATPGGIHGQQPECIARVKRWRPGYCAGRYVRNICWIDIRDLTWVLSEGNNRKLFVNKIPFEFSSDLLKCMLESLLRRRYPMGTRGRPS